MKPANRRLLPPMTALMAFEAAARHGTFARAAKEVALTQSAVSKQIATLERWLGTPLFERIGRRVSLTASGRLYAMPLTSALEQIRRATAAVAVTSRVPSPISIATLPGFGMRWLAPRLTRLFARHPELPVNFSSRVVPFDFKTEPLDAAIHFGRADWPGTESDLLMREEMAVVCSPEFASTHKLRQPADVLQHTLLEQSTRPHAWSAWFAATGIEPKTRRTRPQFEHFMMLAQAAAAGAGFALVPKFLVQPELTSGALVSPFDITITSDEAYFLVYPKAQLQNASFLLFRAWLLEEIHLQ